MGGDYVSQGVETSNILFLVLYSIGYGVKLCHIYAMVNILICSTIYTYHSWHISSFCALVRNISLLVLIINFLLPRVGVLPPDICVPYFPTLQYKKKNYMMCLLFKVYSKLFQVWSSRKADEGFHLPFFSARVTSTFNFLVLCTISCTTVIPYLSCMYEGNTFFDAVSGCKSYQAVLILSCTVNDECER